MTGESEIVGLRWKGGEFVGVTTRADMRRAVERKFGAAHAPHVLAAPEGVVFYAVTEPTARALCPCGEVIQLYPAKTSVSDVTR